MLYGIMNLKYLGHLFQSGKVLFLLFYLLCLSSVTSLFVV